MHPRNIEVVHVIRKMVSIAEDPAPRAHRKMKRQTALVLSLRGCIRVSIMLSLTWLLYRNFVRWRIE